MGQAYALQGSECAQIVCIHTLRHSVCALQCIHRTVLCYAFFIGHKSVCAHIGRIHACFCALGAISVEVCFSQGTLALGCDVRRQRHHCAHNTNKITSLYGELQAGRHGCLSLPPKRSHRLSDSISVQWRGAGLGWMAPSNISLAVHYMKSKAEALSGPNLTVGGEWAHVHATVQASRGRAFPSLLYQMLENYSLNVSQQRHLLHSLNPGAFHWYTAECAYDHRLLREASMVRAMKLTRSVRGPKAPEITSIKYIGGHPPGWSFSGCNPSRFRLYPRWPPSEEAAASISPYSFGHQSIEFTEDLCPSNAYIGAH